MIRTRWWPPGAGTCAPRGTTSWVTCGRCSLPGRAGWCSRATWTTSVAGRDRGCPARSPSSLASDASGAVEGRGTHVSRLLRMALPLGLGLMAVAGEGTAGDLIDTRLSFVFADDNVRSEEHTSELQSLA